VTVIFQPQLAGEATATAYCVVNGREERLVLRLQGKGLGPKATNPNPNPNPNPNTLTLTLTLTLTP